MECLMCVCMCFCLVVVCMWCVVVFSGLVAAGSNFVINTILYSLEILEMCKMK